MTDAVYWVWMQRALGVGSIKVDKVLRQIGSPDLLYNMTRDQLKKTGLFAPGEIDKIKSVSLDDAKNTLSYAKNHKCTVITPDDNEFPTGLKNIDCIPCALYVQGNLLGLNDELLITLVGTRQNTTYGERAARRLSFDLAAAGCVVVSGLAMGIDFASHEGSLSANGRTIGLLACGLDVDYPSLSHELKKRILDSGGALITEFPFGERPVRYHFNIRNRLLSGISSGVVVIQAPERSGALNTANHALEQNRDVFAVPGEIFDISMAGCNRLIRDGSKIVINVYSILEEYINRFPDKMDPRTIVSKIRKASKSMKNSPLNVPKKVKHKKQPSNEKKQIEQQQKISIKKLNDEELKQYGISELAAKIYRLLDIEPVDFELISVKTGVSAMEILAALTELELLDLISSLPGKRYIIHA